MKKTKTKKQTGLFANPLYRNSTVSKAVKKLEMTVNMKQSKHNKNLSDTSPSQVESDDDDDNDELEKMVQENIDIIEKHRKEINKRDAEDTVQVHKIRITVGLWSFVLLSCFTIAVLVIVFDILGRNDIDSKNKLFRDCIAGMSDILNVITINAESTAVSVAYAANGLLRNETFANQKTVLKILHNMMNEIPNSGILSSIVGLYTMKKNGHILGIERVPNNDKTGRSDCNKNDTARFWCWGSNITSPSYADLFSTDCEAKCYEHFPVTKKTCGSCGSVAPGL